MILKEIKLTRNDGLALPVILVLLLVITILGVSSLSNSTVQERMTAGQQLRSLGFNFAETTLRQAENEVLEIFQDIREDELSTQSGVPFRFFSTIDDKANNPDWRLGFPAIGTPNPGDSCTGGYCTPIEHDLSGTNPTVERWNDPAIWADAERHRVLQGFTADELLEQDIAQTPQYIIEFLGQIPIQETAGNPESAECTEVPESQMYPFCKKDPFFFRITSRVISGSGGRESVVMLQSTVIVE